MTTFTTDERSFTLGRMAMEEMMQPVYWSSGQSYNFLTLMISGVGCGPTRLDGWLSGKRVTCFSRLLVSWWGHGDGPTNLVPMDRIWPLALDTIFYPPDLSWKYEWKIADVWVRSVRAIPPETNPRPWRATAKTELHKPFYAASRRRRRRNNWEVTSNFRITSSRPNSAIFIFLHPSQSTELFASSITVRLRPLFRYVPPFLFAASRGSRVRVLPH